jgi:hypothetical protein
MRQRKLRNGLVHWCRTIEITCKPADAPDHIADASVDPVVIDPPYYANIMYAELSDFFYTWLKRTAGYVYPQWFRRPLTEAERGGCQRREIHHLDGIKPVAIRNFIAERVPEPWKLKSRRSPVGIT